MRGISRTVVNGVTTWVQVVDSTQGDKKVEYTVADYKRRGIKPPWEELPVEGEELRMNEGGRLV